MIRMLKILVIVMLSSLAVSSIGYSQGIYQRPNNSYGIIYNRVRADSSLLFATYCGVPVGAAGLHSINQKMSALYYDSCGHQLYVFDPSDSTWSIAGGGSDHSITTGSRTVNADYIQNWNRHQLIFDTTKDVRIYSNAPDWNFTNNKHTFLFEHYNSVIGSPPLSLKWSLRNVTNTSDSVGGGIVSDLYSTTVSHNTGSQSGQLILGDGTAQIAGYGAKSSTVTTYQGTITLDAADSIMARLKSAATADSIVGVVNYGFGLNKLVKIPNTGGGSATLSNVGSGFRLVKTAGGQIKTLFGGYGITPDSSSNTNGITLKADTTGSNGIVTRSELKDTTSRLKKAISDSLIYALKSILIPSRLEFINSSDTATYQDNALIGSQIMMLSIESYQVGFTTRSTSVYMSFDAATGTISLTNGEFTAGDQVIIIYRTAPVFLLDGSGNPIRDGSGNFIILN